MELNELSVRINEDQYDELIVPETNTSENTVKISQHLERENGILEKILSVMEGLADGILHNYVKTRRKDKLDELDNLESEREQQAKNKFGAQTLFGKFAGSEKLKSLKKDIEMIGEDIGKLGNILGLGVIGIFFNKILGFFASIGTLAGIIFNSKFRAEKLESKGFMKFKSWGRLMGWLFGVVTFITGFNDELDKLEKEEGANRSWMEKGGRAALAGLKNVFSIIFGMFDWLIDSSAWLLDKMGFKKTGAKVKEMSVLSEKFDNFVEYVVSFEDVFRLWLTDRMENLYDWGRRQMKGIGKFLGMGELFSVSESDRDFKVDRGAGRYGGRFLVNRNIVGYDKNNRPIFDSAENSPNAGFKKFSFEELENKYLSGEINSTNSPGATRRYENYLRAQEENVSEALRNVVRGMGQRDENRLSAPKALAIVQGLRQDTPAHIWALPEVQRWERVLRQTYNLRLDEQVNLGQINPNPTFDRDQKSPIKIGDDKLSTTKRQVELKGASMEASGGSGTNIITVAPSTSQQTINNTSSSTFVSDLLSPVDNLDGWLQYHMR